MIPGSLSEELVASPDLQPLELVFPSWLAFFDCISWALFAHEPTAICFSVGAAQQPLSVVAVA